ncbi:cupin domain-containing protein [Billgrantia endophytica]|uniref:Transcription negative regulator ChrR n=1 Tax=Billgrantia endophytica TaxID=2033802 RepID=A0A2N7U2G2_9GAMM|nr:cupin domain-containing protein [Halomonas endophytica]PMR74624.1 transcription negative regulator ChrR [Halomonas endophytica]
MIKLNLHDAENAELAWEDFTENGRKHVKHLPLFDATDNCVPGSRCSLLKYLPGAVTLPHVHTGYELIFVLSGVLYDDFGEYLKGDLIVYHPESKHGLRSPDGCVFLVIWEKPVTLAVEVKR